VLELRQILADAVLDGGESTGNNPSKVFNTDQAKDIIDYFHTRLLSAEFSVIV